MEQASRNLWTSSGIILYLSESARRPVVFPYSYLPLLEVRRLVSRRHRCTSWDEYELHDAKWVPYWISFGAGGRINIFNRFGQGISSVSLLFTQRSILQRKRKRRNCNYFVLCLNTSLPVYFKLMYWAYLIYGSFELCLFDLKLHTFVKWRVWFLVCSARPSGRKCEDANWQRQDSGNDYKMQTEEGSGIGEIARVLRTTVIGYWILTILTCWHGHPDHHNLNLMRKIQWLPRRCAQALILSYFALSHFIFGP